MSLRFGVYLTNESKINQSIIDLFLVPRKILKRLLEELNGWFKQKTQTNQQELGGQSHSIESANINEDVLSLIRNLSEMVQRITRAGFRTVIIIDALNKVDDTGKTAKVIKDITFVSPI